MSVLLCQTDKEREMKKRLRACWGGFTSICIRLLVTSLPFFLPPRFVGRTYGGSLRSIEVQFFATRLGSDGQNILTVVSEQGGMKHTRPGGAVCANHAMASPSQVQQSLGSVLFQPNGSGIQVAPSATMRNELFSNICLLTYGCCLCRQASRRCSPCGTRWSLTQVLSMKGRCTATTMCARPFPARTQDVG